MSANQQIEAAHARNLAVQRSRLASIPEVGMWATLQRLLPQFKGKEYTDFQRGRVLYDSMEDVFLVYSSRVNSPGLRKMILTEFELPSAATEFAADYHYENVIPPMPDQDFDGSL